MNFTVPAETTLLGLPGRVFHGALLLVALSAFAFILWRRFDLLRRGAPDPRLGEIGRRIRALLTVGFGQSRQPRYPVAGWLHILIFAGFLVLSLRSLTLLGEGFVAGFRLPGFGEGSFLAAAYAVLKDWTALVVFACCVFAAVRRGIFRPARYHDRHAVRSHGAEAYVILGLIAFLMVADGIYEGAGRAIRLEGWTASEPWASAFGLLLAPLDDGALATASLAAFWLHNAALLFFLCYLPVSKHFHVITSLPNVFLLNTAPPGRIKPPRHGVASLDAVERLGVGRLEDFTWKHLLDFYSCTDCGRCSDNCPAYATGTPLSPRMISIKSRDLAYDLYPVFGRTAPEEGRPALVGDVIKQEELWACTTCGACEDACPILIEYVDKIVDMRRRLVEEGEVPASLGKPMAALEKHGNPYGKPAKKRGDWLAGDGGAGSVRVLDEGEEADVLFFADSAASYDPRIQKIARSFGRVLGAAGVDAGTLGAEEADSGHEARRLGEEGLFEALRDQNREAMAARKFRRVVTTDPHAMNALRHDYATPEPVLHHSEMLAELLRGGKLRLGALRDGKTYTFHDPCYLGRHNGCYDPPREVLGAIPGIRTVEMERSRNRSFCCGGGSLYLFYEGEAEARMGVQRLEMAVEAGADVVVTACPFCLINLEDAIKTTGREGKVEVIDLGELVERSMDAAAAGPAEKTEPR